MSGSENKLANLVVGARGWEHPRWLEAYYPDDLPEDWRLDYYSNEFGCVILPADLWMMTDEDVIEQWLEEAEDDFMFFLELPEQPTDAAARLAVFAGRCDGAVLLQGRAEDWQEMLGNIPLLQTEDTENLKRFHLTGQTEPVLAWLQAGADEKIELPVLREQIEAGLKGVSGSSRLAFVIGNEDPAMENLQNAKVLAELLGA